MTNNLFFKSTLAVLSTGCLSAQSLSAQKSPNILIAIADDWSYPHAGTYGCKWVSTPAFDYVAQNGIIFSNCLVSIFRLL